MDIGFKVLVIRRGLSMSAWRWSGAQHSGLRFGGTKLRVVFNRLRPTVESKPR